jgi:hypothetical protein
MSAVLNNAKIIGLTPVWAERGRPQRGGSPAPKAIPAAVRAEVAQTIADPAELHEELRYLAEALSQA